VTPPKLKFLLCWMIQTGTVAAFRAGEIFGSLRVWFRGFPKIPCEISGTPKCLVEQGQLHCPVGMERTRSRNVVGGQSDAEAAAAAWNSAHATPAVRAPKLVRAATQQLSLPLSRVSRSRDSAKSARATPRTRTLLIWGHGDQSSGLDEVRETSLKMPAGARTRMHAHAHAPARSRAAGGRHLLVFAMGVCFSRRGCSLTPLRASGYQMHSSRGLLGLYGPTFQQSVERAEIFTAQVNHSSTQSRLPGAINIPSRLVSTAPGHMQSRARDMHDLHNRNYTSLAHSGFLTQRGSNNRFVQTPPSSGFPPGSPRRSSQHMLRNEILNRGASAFEVACFSCTFLRLHAFCHFAAHFSRGSCT
jgi:hypothetical protein